MRPRAARSARQMESEDDESDDDDVDADELPSVARKMPASKAKATKPGDQICLAQMTPRQQMVASLTDCPPY